jgi:conjugative transfer signal peptidase TraF
VARAAASLITMVSAATVLVLTMAWRPVPWVIWNASASVPTGFYRVGPIRNPVAKDLVIVMPPEPLAIFLADRGYLPRGVPLIKPVLALAGQTVCREDLRIMVDDVYAGAAHSHDRLGRPLPEWQGCLIVGEDNVFLMNPNAPASLDGRYFGALPVSSMMGTAMPVCCIGIGERD